MDLHRRKLWGDRFTWLLVVGATGVIVSQFLRRQGPFQRWLLFGWTIVVTVLLLSELRVGKRAPRPSPRALYAGWAKYVGEERLEPGGDRTTDWTGTVSGIMEFVPFGIRWMAKPDQPGPREIVVPWPELHGWRMNGVVPLVWRASGYLTLTLKDGRELVFHVQGTRRWQQALREAAIVGPTFVRPEWLPEDAAPELPLLLADAIQSPDLLGVSPAPPPWRAEPTTKEVAPAGGSERLQEEPPATDAIEAEVAAAAPSARASGPAGAADGDRAFEAVIGLECHVELSTHSKVFCGCPTEFGAEPNTQVCPVCTGQPGSLPVLNEKAVEYALRIALALNCRIAPESIFHRKNYFYPDMPKNYQISQYDVPLATDGYLEFDLDGQTRRVGIHRVHIEEDTGKTTHVSGTGRIAEAEYARVDYNRAGVPLVEIVSEPEIRAPDEARAYLGELRSLLESLGVSDVKMEQGSLRCDANVSMRPAGASELGTKAEVKNMNSMRSVQRALEFEIERQTDLLEQGKPVVQETRHFDEDTGKTSPLRTKEYAFDYRYFPDPDLVPLAPDRSWIDHIKSSLPELPAQRRRRFVEGFGLTQVDSRTLTASKALADAFEAAVKGYGGDAKAIARWYVGELSALAHEKGAEPHEVLKPEHIAELQRLVDAGDVSISLAKGKVLREVAESGRSPTQVVQESGLAQISDAGELESVVDEVIASSADVVEKIRAGKTGAIQALKGQIMKRTQGRANPQLVDELLKRRLELA